MVKRYVKNITGGKEFPIAVELAYRENGKVINIKPGEKKELKTDIDVLGNEKKLIYVEKDDKKTKEVEDGS